MSDMRDPSHCRESLPHTVSDMQINTDCALQSGLVSFKIAACYNSESPELPLSSLFTHIHLKCGSMHCVYA